MKIALSKNSDVPLRQQLAEQVVFLITSGQLRSGQQLPSVRALARQLGIHHNTVSEAYQDLVRRNWVTRQPGSRHVIGAHPASRQRSRAGLDELINDTIGRAREMGFSLQALTECVRNRLLAQPPDYLVVVEEEAGLREIICREVQEASVWPLRNCSPAQVVRNADLLVAAQVLAPSHVIEELQELIPRSRLPIPLTYSGVDEHIDLIRKLQKPSMIAVVSVSGNLLKTAHSLLAPAVGRRHAFQGFLLSSEKSLDLKGVDVAFCDSIAMAAVNSPLKIHYRLISPECLRDLAGSFGSAAQRSALR